MIQTLNTGADALTMADQNEESANLLALNTQQQLAQTALSLASQANAAITRLF
jgi:flagellin-like hook-associated protein FlgL